MIRKTRKILPGILWMLAVSLRLFAQTAPGTEIENVAFADYRDAGGFVYSVQSQAVITPVGDGYSLSISKSAERSVYMPSDTVLYLIVLQNSGNIAASSVSVTDTLSADLIYVSSQPAATVSGQSLSWNLLTIQPGAVGEITLRAVVAPGVLPGVSLENTASYRTPEEVRGRTAPASISIGSLPDLVLEKVVDRS
ncbi:MAG: DUF11 domain-containing protein, partial [Chitinispirillaceae bacterium]|nr:DUF11 domain-containing protein [Chitinispirillaceae bacterium]